MTFFYLANNVALSSNWSIKSWWHLSQWIIIKDLRIPISKTRLKLVCWDNFTPSPEIIYLFSSDDRFVCHGGKLIFIVTIFNPSGLCLLKGTRYPPHVSFVTTPQGGLSQEHACCMRSQSHERSWPHLLKLKFGNGWLISKCCCTSCQKIQFWFSIPIPIPIPGFSILIPIPFSIPPISILIPIPELELEIDL